MIAPLHELVAGISQVATGALATALWQGALLAGAAALGLRLLPETPAPVRFAIWFAVFLLVAGLPFLPAPVGHGAGTGTMASSHPWLTLDARWCIWIAAVWLAASLVRAITLFAAALRVRALWKSARAVESGLPKAARGAQVCVSNEVDRPTVIGFFAPKIILPEWLMERLSPAELEQVVLHEAGHLSRRDDWLNLLQKIALVLFPLNPALAWVERRLCFERELACDERVLRATGSPKAYAECLATLAEYRLERRGLVRELALALGALGRESELAHRVLRILRGGGRMNGSQARMVFGGSMLTLLFAATALERSPQIVGFTHPAEQHAAAVGESGSRNQGASIVAVRASVVPTEQWKSVGDAPPHVAKPPVRRGLSPQARVQRDVSDLVEQEGNSPAVPMLVRQATDSQTTDANVNRATAVAIKTGSSERSRATVPAMYAPRIVQTMATRQVTADGEVIVTQSMTFTSWNAAARGADTSRSVTDTPAQDRPVQQQLIRSFAAVPVQGGWLVFQL